MITLLKKAAKWYFEKSSKTYVWLPSGMLPCNFD